MGRRVLRGKQFKDLANLCCKPAIEGSISEDDVAKKMAEAHDKLLAVLDNSRNFMATLAAASFTLKMISQDWGGNMEYYISKLPLQSRVASLESLRHGELFLAWGKYPNECSIDD